MNKETSNMRNFLNAWQASDKYKQLKLNKLIYQSSEEFLIKKIMADNDKNKVLSPKQLKAYHDELIYGEEFMSSDVNESIINDDPTTLFRTYCKQQIWWHHQLFFNIYDEKFEQCALIKDIIDYLQVEAIALIQKLRKDVSTSFTDELREVNKYYLEIVNKKIDDSRND